MAALIAIVLVYATPYLLSSGGEPATRAVRLDLARILLMVAGLVAALMAWRRARAVGAALDRFNARLVAAAVVVAAGVWLFHLAVIIYYVFIA